VCVCAYAQSSKQMREIHTTGTMVLLHESNSMWK
jgi:hypothetical protein